MTDKEWNEAVLDTLTSDGWRLLEEKYKEQIETLKESLVRIGDETTHNVTRGRLHEIRFILGYRELIEQTLEDINEEVE